MAEPELIKQIMVKDFHAFPTRPPPANTYHEIVDLNLAQVSGEPWKRIRAILSPTFSSGKIRKMFPMVRQSLAEFLETLDGCAKNKQEINAKVSVCVSGSVTRCYHFLLFS